MLDTAVVIAHLGAPGGGEPMSKWRDFAHLRALIASDAARVAESTEELVRHVCDYLADPALDRAQRRTISELECGPLHGHAGWRLGQMLLREVGLRSEPAERRLTPAT